jgi:creatinine amidohydrolase
VVAGWLANGVSHVCLVNNHLEPAQDSAARKAIEGLAPGKASVACPLTTRWARTLSSEFKSGACHAGKYETSIVLAARPDLVRESIRKGLPAVPVSLSEKLGAGVVDFVEMGLVQAYAGAPAEATAEHGHEQLERLAVMIATEVLDALGRPSSGGKDASTGR